MRHDDEEGEEGEEDAAHDAGRVFAGVDATEMTSSSARVTPWVTVCRYGAGAPQDGRDRPSEGSASDFPRRGRAYGARSVRPARTAHSLWEMGQNKARLWAAPPRAVSFLKSPPGCPGRRACLPVGDPARMAPGPLPWDPSGRRGIDPDPSCLPHALLSLTPYIF